MAKTLTYQELMDYARKPKNYAMGGEFIAECWEEKDFDEYVKLFGPITKRDALFLFRLQKSHFDDIVSTIW